LGRAPARATKPPIRKSTVDSRLTSAPPPGQRGKRPASLKGVMGIIMVAVLQEEEEEEEEEEEGG